MILCLLFCLSFSASVIKISDPEGNQHGLFDLKYVANSGNEHTLSHNKEGFYVGYRVYGMNQDAEETETNVLSTAKAETGGIKISFTSPVDKQTKYQTIVFTVENNGNVNKNVDIGVFVDSDFSDNDNAEIKMRSDKRGFTVADKESSVIYTLLARGAMFTDATNIYIASEPNTQAKDPKTYPYFSNNEKDSGTKNDNVYSLSWTKQLIKPGETKEFGFVIAPNTDLKLPPSVRDLTEKKDFYPPNEDIDVKFEAIDFDSNEKITCTFNRNGTSITETPFTTSSTKTSQIYTEKVNLKNQAFLKYSVKCTDSKGYYSNPIENTLLSAIAKAPTLVIDSELKEEYDHNEKIIINGVVTDEIKAKVSFKFNEDGKVEQIVDKAVDTKGQVIINASLQIPSHLEAGKKHTLFIWAEDNLGINSTVFNHTFTLALPPAPTIETLYFSESRIKPGQMLVIYGEATDPTLSDVLNFSMKIGDREPVNLGTIQIITHPTPYSFIYIVPDITPSIYNISLTATDKTGLPAVKTLVKPIEIVDINAPNIQELRGNVTDTTDKLDESNNACFDVMFVDLAGKRHATTFWWEGYYVGFRTYNEEGIPSETKLIKHTEGSKTQDEDLSITYHSQYDPITGYLQVMFDVNNSGYWPQTIDLSVFADAELGNGAEDDGIKMREDGRGFVLSDEKLGIYLTMFTRDFGTFPSVDATFLDEVPRDESDSSQLDVTQMPFFRKSDNKETHGNAMYSFSWLQREIRPDTVVTFGFTVAPDHRIKTPARIIDETEKKNYYTSDEEVTLKFKIIDGDIGEQIALNLWLNGENETHYFNITSSDEEHEFTKTVNIGSGNGYRYKAYAVDNDSRFVSNLIDRTLPISYPPGFNLDTYIMKNRYLINQTIPISGYVYDETGVSIKYQFNNGRIHIAQSFYTESEYDYVEYYKNIPIPEQLKPGREYNLTVWAEDDEGIRTSWPYTHKFYLAVPINPHLLKAGLSTRVVHAGDRVLGYALINDEALDTDVYIYAKIGNENWRYVSRATQKSDLTPFAFYYYVPKPMDKGTYDITFRAQDSDDLYSPETITRTLMVT